MNPSDFESSYRSLAETAADAIVIIDERGTLVFVNGAAEHIFDYTASELLGQPLTMLMPNFLDKLQEAERQRYVDLGELNVHWRGGELLGRRKDGSGIALEISFGQFNQGGLRFLTGIARDITQRKQQFRVKAVYTAVAQLLAEHCSSDWVLSQTVQRICEALEWNVGILWHVDSGKDVLHCASGWCVGGEWTTAVRKSLDIQLGKMSGLPGRVWRNKEPASISHLDKDSDFGSRGFAEGAPLWSVALPVTLQDEVMAVMEFFTTDLEAADQALLDTLRTIGHQVGQYIEHRKAEQALQRNETELRRLVQSEQEARLQAEAANNAKDEFLAIVSHELRTPLTSVYGWVQLLQTRVSDPDTMTKGLVVIERNVQAQTRIVDDLLHISELLSGKLRIQRELLNPMESVTAAIDTVLPSADAKEIQILLLETTSHIEKIAADPQRLHQIVWNLLLNAVKFTPRGGWITVQIEEVAGEVVIVVTDNGEGIAADFLPFVFQRFSQADTTSTRQHGGLGIGLALVRQLVELHGGHVMAESEGKGCGSRFTVSLPMPQVIAEFPTRRVIPIKSAPTLENIHVLLVEDDADTRELVAQGLEQFGASVVQAASGAEALNQLEAETPDILICDIGMPEMDGYEMLAIMRQRRATMPPAMALTAFVSRGEKERALRAGFQAYLAKPVALKLLSSVAAHLVARSA